MFFSGGASLCRAYRAFHGTAGLGPQGRRLGGAAERSRSRKIEPVYGSAPWPLSAPLCALCIQVIYQEKLSAPTRNAPPLAHIFPMSDERRIAPRNEKFGQRDRALRTLQGKGKHTQPVTQEPPHPFTLHPAARHAGWPPVRADARCGSITRDHPQLRASFRTQKKNTFSGSAALLCNLRANVRTRLE